MSNILEVEKIVFNVLAKNTYLSQNKIPVVNYTVDTSSYPFVRIANTTKVVNDSFNDQIVIDINVVSNKLTSLEVFTIADAIEADFKSPSLLSSPFLQTLGLTILPSILSYRVVKTQVYQDDPGYRISRQYSNYDPLFNAIITVSFVV